MTANKKIAILVTALLCAWKANAQWTSDPTLNTPVCTTATTQQMFPQAAGDGNGGVYITWLEGNADLSSSMIYAQHLSASGTKLWAAGGVEVSGGSGILSNPQIVSDGNGGAVISFINQNTPGIKFYMQRIAATGQTLWTPGGVLVSDIIQTPVPYYQLIGDGQGGATLIWDDSRGGNIQVYGQHIDAAGNRMWAASGLPLTRAFTDMLTYDAVPDNKGGIIICFGRNSGLLNLHEIYVQHINADGMAEWETTGINLSNVPGDQLFCKIAKDTNDHVIVIWQDFRLDPAWSRLYGQRIDSVGNLQWGPNGKMLADSVVPDYTWTKIVSDSKKGAVITWFDNYDPIGQNDTARLYGIRIDSTGNNVWAKKELVAWYIGQVPYEYELAPDFKGGAYISFMKIFTYGGNPSLDGYDLGAQHIYPDGSLEFPLTGMAVSSVPMNQFQQQLATDSSGLAVVVWTDLRSMTNYDLYAMRIGAPATLPVTWLHFAGKLTGSSVSLTWQTSHEENNKGFTIQRSSNGNQFDSIGFKAASYSPGGAQYTFNDVNPLPGQNFYRLQQTDIDGKISYSRVIRVDGGMENWLRLYPNPAREKIVVSGTRPGSILTIYDAAGRKRKQVVVNNAMQEISIDDLAPGIYYLVEPAKKNKPFPFFVF